jgi:hypothetical protein
VAHQLPYVGGDTVTADHVAPGLRIGAPMAPTPFVPPEAREPDAANEPDAGVLSLARYAAIKVALLRGRPIAAALGEHGLDEVTWRMEEQRRAEALAHAADNGDLAIIHQLRRAMRDAQRAADEPAD